MVANMGGSPSESLTLLLSVAPIHKKNDVYQAQYFKIAPNTACREFAEKPIEAHFFCAPLEKIASGSNNQGDF